MVEVSRAETADLQEGQSQDALPVGDWGLLDVLQRLWRGRLVVFCAVLLALLCAVLYLHRATYTHTIALKLTPSSTSEGGLSGGMKGLGGLASIAGLSGGSQNSAAPFDLYLEMIKSEEVAKAIAERPELMRVIFSSQWDEGGAQWRQPPSTLRPIVRGVKSLLGIPVYEWAPPGHDDVLRYLSREVQIERNAKIPIVTIHFNHRDPAFGVRFLEALDEEADRIIRAAALERANNYAAYLEKKLAAVAVAEHRQSIVEALSGQEKAIMMASSTTPYAATIVSGPSASQYPTKPNAPIVVVAALLIGGALGSVLVLGGKGIVDVVSSRRSKASAEEV